VRKIICHLYKPNSELAIKYQVKRKTETNQQKIESIECSLYTVYAVND